MPYRRLNYKKEKKLFIYFEIKFEKILRNKNKFKSNFLLIVRQPDLFLDAFQIFFKERNMKINKW